MQHTRSRAKTTQYIVLSLTSLWASATAFIAVYQSRDIGASLALFGSSKYFFGGVATHRKSCLRQSRV
ncbi:hypothetical protein ACHAXM_011672 [Skeletonema potamos]